MINEKELAKNGAEQPEEAGASTETVSEDPKVITSEKASSPSRKKTSPRSKSPKSDPDDERIRKRKSKHGIISAAVSILVLAAIVLINLISTTLTSKLPSLTADLTGLRSFQLNNSSIKVAEKLKHPTEIIFLTDKTTYINSNPYYKHAAFTAEEMVKHSGGKLEVKYRDVMKTPSIAREYNSDSLSATDVIVSGNGKTRILSVDDMFELEYYPESSSYVLASSKAEQSLCNALTAVNDDQVTNVVFIKDNCAFDYDYFKKRLEEDFYTTSEISLESDPIPASADTVIIYAPEKDFSEAAVKKLDSFLQNGGDYGKNLICAADAENIEMPNLKSLLVKYNLELGDAIVFDTDKSRIDRSSSTYSDGILCAYYSDLYTDKLTEKTNPVITGYSRPVTGIEADSFTPLLVLSNSSGKVPFDAEDELDEEYIQNAITGKECVLAKSETGSGDKTSTVILSGTFRVFAEPYYGSSYGNSEYFSSMLATINHREQSSISLPVKVITEYDLELDKNTANTLGFLVFALIPLCILGAGLTVYLLRRNR